MQLLQGRPPHRNCVASLPCEIQKSNGLAFTHTIIINRFY